jgi:hypothetical protein
MSDKCFDDLSMTGMSGQHQGRLSVAIEGIHIRTTSKKVTDDLDIIAFDCIRQGGIRHLKTPAIYCPAETLPSH